ncbi:MAG: AIR synthase family protein [Negativicutes bacterium]|jgi:hydrogenase maturation factor
MSYGKLSVDALRKSVLQYSGHTRAEVLVGAEFGEDSAALKFDNEIMVVSSDPITGADRGTGRLAVIVSSNDIIANGAEPVAILLTLLMPETADEYDVEQIMRDADAAAKELNIEIIGGHTEFTAAVNKPVVCATTIGKTKKLVKSSGVCSGNDLVLTKGAGIEGTAILFSDFSEQLEQRFSPQDFAVAQQFSDQLSVAPEGRIALKHQTTAMHDVTEGGVLGAVYEMSESGRLGVKIYADKIPVSDVTERLCAQLNVDPLRLISSGSLLVAVQNGDLLVEELLKNGIQAAVIGTITQDDRKIIIRNGIELNIAKPVGDELWKAIAQLKAGF